MAKTIKELADELGVNKDRIKYQTRKLPSNLTTKKKGITYLSNEAIEVISSIIIGNNTQVLPDDITHSLPTDFILIELQKRDLELAEKNKQINNLQQALSTQQKLLDQQQILTLQANKKIAELETTTKESFDTHEEFHSKKQGFWSRFFH